MSYNNKIEQEHRAQVALENLKQDFEKIKDEPELIIILDDQEVVDILLSVLNIHNYSLSRLRLSAGGSLKIELNKEG